MNLIIEETVGDTALRFTMDGDYEEVLALVSELGYLDDKTECVLQDVWKNPQHIIKGE